MSAPVSSAPMKRSMISTGMVRSASKTAIGSPVAASAPARTAAPLPRCGRRRTLKLRPRCECATLARWNVAAVASVEPSSARMISPSISRSRKNSAHRPRLSSMRRASLYAGNTRLSINERRAIRYAPRGPYPCPRGASQPALSVSRGEAARLGEDSLAARRTAAPEATSVAARSRTAALVAVAVPLSLGALPCLVVVPVLVHCADREVHPPHAIDLGHLDLDLVANFDRVLDAVHALRRELADADEALLAGEVLNERPDAHDARDLAVVDLANLGLLGEALDHGARLLAPLGLG